MLRGGWVTTIAAPVFAAWALILSRERTPFHGAKSADLHALFESTFCTLGSAPSFWMDLGCIDKGAASIMTGCGVFRRFVCIEDECRQDIPSEEMNFILVTTCW